VQTLPEGRREWQKQRRAAARFAAARRLGFKLIGWWRIQICECLAYRSEQRLGRERSSTGAAGRARDLARPREDAAAAL